ncbi:sugar kinase [Phytohabitans flavus]|uniref:sugar kinase n=1 Tax=Phytohabitans flavus TaxID=1076124 RepID=UPI0036320A3B
MARLGHAVRWVGVTGADELGALVLRTLRAEGVDVSACGVAPEAPTGLIIFEPRVADLTRVSYYRSGSAGSRLSEAEAAAAFEGATPRVLHVTGITPALGDGPRDAVTRAVAQAKTVGATVCLDVNHRARLWSVERAAATLRPLLSSVDIVVASEDELPVLVDPGADPLTTLFEAGVSEVVIKRGGDGASAHRPHLTVDRPARRVPVVDTVGAGDAFVAGYLSGLLDDADVAGRLDRAVATGAFAVASRGDWEGLPTRAELGLLDAVPGTTLR